MKKIFLMLFIITGLFAGITYDTSSNAITVTGGGVTTEFDFQGIYNTDKSSMLTLVARTGITGPDGAPVNHTINARPADYVVVGDGRQDLYIAITNWSGFTSASITLVGTDIGTNALNDVITVTGNGTYYATKNFMTQTQSYCNAVSVGPGTFDYSVVQGQWGVVYKQGDTHFHFECDLEIADGDSGWLADTLKQISFGSGYEFNIRGLGHFRSGVAVDTINKITKNGCAIMMDFTSVNNYVRCYGELELYSSTLMNLSGRTYGQYLFDPDSANSKMRVWNSNLSGVNYIRESGAWLEHEYNWYRSNIENCDYGLNLSTGIFPVEHLIDVVVMGCNKGIRITWLGYYAHDSTTIRNLWLKGITSEDFAVYNCGKNYPWGIYIIDAISDWTFSWTGTQNNGAVHRRYTFNLKVVDEDGDSVNTARARCWDVDTTLLFDIYTDVHGDIAEQIIEYGTYDSLGGNTITLASPHCLIVSKSGYDDITVIWNMDEPADWLLTLTDPCYPWTIEQINAAAASGFNHDSVANYPMSWNGAVLTCWGDDGSGGKYPMGYDTLNPIEQEHIWAFAAYTLGTCICAKDNDDAFTMKKPLIIGDGIHDTYFASENQAIWQYNYFKVKNHARMRIGTISTNAGNPYSYPKWGSTWTIDRKTNPDGQYCYFVANGGSLFVYDSRIALTDNSKCFDTQAGSYTYVAYSTLAGYDRQDANYIRWFGALKLDHMINHHCRNFNVAGIFDTLSQYLVIYCNQNNLQVRDNEAWIYDATLILPITCACKTLRFSDYGQANHVDPIGFDRTKVCVQSYSLNWQKMWHRFARKVKDYEGDSIVGAIVEVFNTSGSLVYCDTTDATGWTDMALVLNWMTTGTGSPPSFIDYNPHTIRVSGPGILTHITELYIDKRMDTWEIKVFRSPYDKILGVD